MEEQKNNKFVLGILGAVIGAFIGAIPWILVYIFGGMIIAFLSVFVAMASYKGYKITKATIDKKLPVIIAVSSILAITVSTFLIIPLGLLAKEGIGANLENLEIIYKSKDFLGAIIGDYVISLVFTTLGISGIIANLHKQIKQGATRDEIKITSSKTKVVIISVVIIIGVVIIMVASAFVYSSDLRKGGRMSTTKGNYGTSTSDNNNSTSKEKYETEHKIDIAKMKFTPLDDLLILTKKEITTYFGANYTAYEIIALNKDGDRMLYCYIDDDEEIKDFTVKEYIEDSINIPEGTEIQTKKIGGFEFQTVKLSFEQNGKKYEEECYFYKVDGKFICFDYSYPEGKTSSFDKMISEF